MAGINWDEPPSMTQGPSREEVAARERELNRTRMALAGALSPLPLEQATNLPSDGGLVGGLLPLIAPELRPIQMMTQIASKAPAFTRPFLPSLMGSTAGTAAGTLGEQALTGQDIFSGETGAKLLSNVLENAAFDVGGNL